MADDAVAYAAHADGLKPALTARENLTFWAQVFGGQGVDRALAAMDLTMQRLGRGGEPPGLRAARSVMAAVTARR